MFPFPRRAFLCLASACTYVAIKSLDSSSQATAISYNLPRLQMQCICQHKRGSCPLTAISNFPIHKPSSCRRTLLHVLSQIGLGAFQGLGNLRDGLYPILRPRHCRFSACRDCQILTIVEPGTVCNDSAPVPDEANGLGK